VIVVLPVCRRGGRPLPADGRRQPQRAKSGASPALGWGFRAGPNPPLPDSPSGVGLLADDEIPAQAADAALGAQVSVEGRNALDRRKQAEHTALDELAAQAFVGCAAAASPWLASANAPRSTRPIRRASGRGGQAEQGQGEGGEQQRGEHPAADEPVQVRPPSALFCGPGHEHRER
jgi:hypothetical protein